MDNNIFDYQLPFPEVRTILAIITVILLVLIFYKENKKKNDKALLLTKETVNVLDLKIKEKGKWENVCNRRKIKISQHNLEFWDGYVDSYNLFGIGNRKYYVTRIESDIYNDTLKSSLIPKPFFVLKRNGADNAKWIYFEKSFNIENKFDLRLSSKNKSKLEQLFVGGYFRGPMSLKIFPPDKAVLPLRGKVIFDLLPKIMQDKNSFKIAMDVVVDIAKQMDEMKIEESKK